MCAADGVMPLDKAIKNKCSKRATSVAVVVQVWWLHVDGGECSDNMSLCVGGQGCREELGSSAKPKLRRRAM